MEPVREVNVFRNSLKADAFRWKACRSFRGLSDEPHWDFYLSGSLSLGAGWLVACRRSHCHWCVCVCVSSPSQHHNRNIGAIWLINALAYREPNLAVQWYQILWISLPFVGSSELNWEAKRCKDIVGFKVALGREGGQTPCEGKK